MKKYLTLNQALGPRGRVPIFTKVSEDTDLRLPNDYSIEEDS
jgi:hypothetical protein